MKGNNLSHWGEINKPFDALTMEKQKTKNRQTRQQNQQQQHEHNRVIESLRVCKRSTWDSS